MGTTKIMGTTNLIRCVNCGHIVSKNAEYCLQCHKEDFIGGGCLFCRERSQKDHLIKLDSPYTGTRLSDFYAHKKCLHRALNIGGIDHADFFCQDCEAVIPKKEIKGHLIESCNPRHNHRVICSNCGSTVAINHLMESCFFCGSTILKGFHEYETIKVKTKGFYNKIIREVSLHKDCVSKLDASIIVADKSIFRMPAKRLKRKMGSYSLI
jgi:DNA-directed RNA polymerase subunit N (RpoN/RPB10)